VWVSILSILRYWTTAGVIDAEHANILPRQSPAFCADRRLTIFQGYALICNISLVTKYCFGWIGLHAGEYIVCLSTSLFTNNGKIEHDIANPLGDFLANKEITI
jgi:hypothetical protein